MSKVLENKLDDLLDRVSTLFGDPSGDRPKPMQIWRVWRRDGEPDLFRREGDNGPWLLKSEAATLQGDARICEVVSSSWPQ